MKSKIYLLLCLICCSICVVYVCFLTEDRYISHSQFSIVVEDTSNVDASVGVLSLITNGNHSNTDVQAAIGFIQSADMLIEVEEEFNLVEHFTAPETDVVYRLERNPSLEARLEYYRNRIVAKYSVASGLIDLSVESYDPKLSYKISESVLARTEKFINELNQNIAHKRLEFVKKELDRAQDTVKESEQNLLSFQNEHHIIQPEAIIQARLESIQSLRLELIRKEIELATLRATASKSPLILAQSTTISKLKEEIKLQEAKLTGTEQQKLGRLLAEYKELQLKLAFSMKLKDGAEILLEKTRAEAISHSRFFSVIQNPYFAEERTNPRRLYLSVTGVVLILLSFYILRAIMMSIYDRV